MTLDVCDCITTPAYPRRALTRHIVATLAMSPIFGKDTTNPPWHPGWGLIGYDVFETAFHTMTATSLQPEVMTIAFWCGRRM